MDFTSKSRWIKDGHRTPNTTAPNYAGVVSREIILVLLTHSDFHIVSVKAAYIQNACLQDPTSEKHYIICVPELGIEIKGNQAVIIPDLYGGKSAGSDFWHHLQSCMDHLVFESSKSDPDVWMRHSN